MSEKSQVPKFATEAEEADWWASNQELVAEWFEAAAEAGTLGQGTAARQARERTADLDGKMPTTIRLDPADAARARDLASKRGLRYQTYLEMLLHEALDAEGKQLAS